jgi:hypothetical protein
MKFASNLGKYEDEWQEGDCKVNGDVPAMIILSTPLVLAIINSLFLRMRWQKCRRERESSSSRKMYS